VSNISLVCAGCGAKNPDDYRFCFSCGSPLPDRAEEPPDQAEAPIRAVATCPKCQATNPEEYLYCKQCGTRLRRRPEPKKALVIPLVVGAIGGIVGAAYSYYRGALPIRVAFAAVGDAGVWWAVAAFITWLVRPSWWRAVALGAAVLLTAIVFGGYVLVQSWTGQYLGYIEPPVGVSTPEVVNTAVSASPTLAPSAAPVATKSISSTPIPTPGTAGADRVIAFNPGPGANAKYGHANDILGAKNGIEKPDYKGFVQLGRGGSILVAFTDNVIIDGPGADFVVYGESAGDDYLRVEVSEDGRNWTYWDKVSESSLEYDLSSSGIAGGIYVRLTDVQPGTSTGAEVDAVVALHSGPAVGASLPSLPDAFAWKALVLREGPSTQMQQAGSAKEMDALAVIGRTTSATWVKVRTLGWVTGWCQATELALNVSLAGYQVVAAAPTPTARPKPTSTRSAFATAPPFPGYREAWVVLNKWPSGDWLNVRGRPTETAWIAGRVHNGTLVYVWADDEPVMADGYEWWEIHPLDTAGWEQSIYAWGGWVPASELVFKTP